MRHWGVFALMGLMSMAAHQAASQEAPSSKGESASVQEVWSREDELGRYEETGDLDAYKSLYHAKFIGWSCNREHPGRKASVGGWVREVRDGQMKVASTVTREGASATSWSCTTEPPRSTPTLTDIQRETQSRLLIHGCAQAIPGRSSAVCAPPYVTTPSSCDPCAGNAETIAA